MQYTTIISWGYFALRRSRCYLPTLLGQWQCAQAAREWRDVGSSAPVWGGCHGDRDASPHQHPLITFAEDKLFQSPQPNWSPRRAETLSINLRGQIHTFLPETPAFRNRPWSRPLSLSPFLELGTIEITTSCTNVVFVVLTVLLYLLLEQY